MYELIHAAGRSYYIESPARMGLYLDGGDEAILIDSGLDKEAGKKVVKILNERGWRLKFIINTHSNADHAGGNRFLWERTGCGIYSSPMECAFINHPLLEPSFVYGGYPMKALRNKFLMAEPSPAKDIAEAPLPAGMQIASLPGHFFGQIGVKSPDGVCYLADCLSGEDILNKYHVAFIYDVAAYLETLDTVEAMQAPFFVPAHAEPGPDMGPLARLNREKVLAVARVILTLCDGRTGQDEMLKRLLDTFGLTLNMNQYVLVGSTLRSYLAWLSDSGKITAEIRDNRLWWTSV